MRTKPPRKPMRTCQKDVAAAGSRIRRSGNRNRRNDGSKSAKPNPRKIPPCTCGGTNFAVVGSDGAMVYVAVKCQSCGEERVLHVQGRKVTVLRKLD
jgi:hypothetical protein